MGSASSAPALDLATSSDPPHLARCDSTTVQWVGWAAVALLLLLQICLLLGGLPRSLHGSTDFRPFYATGKLVALHRSGEIYNLAAQANAQHAWISRDDQTLPFLYPAFAAILFVPLSYLSFKAAFLAFAAINLAILLLITRWVAKELGVQNAATSWLAYGITLGTVPTVMFLLQGQISCLLTCVFIGALELVRRKQDNVAGMLLALLFAKFQLAIPIVLLLCAWRRWALVRGMFCGTLLLALLSVMMIGPAASMGYIHMMSSLTRVTAADPVSAKAMYGMFPADMPNIHGITYVLAAGRNVSVLIAVLLSGILMLWAARRDRGLPVAFCVAMLVSYHFQAYDLVVLLVPLCVSLGELIRQRNECIPAGVAQMKFGLQSRLVLISVACGLLVTPVGAALVYSRMSWIFCIATIAILISLCPRARCE